MLSSGAGVDALWSKMKPIGYTKAENKMWRRMCQHRCSNCGHTYDLRFVSYKARYLPNTLTLLEDKNNVCSECPKCGYVE